MIPSIRELARVPADQRVIVLPTGKAIRLKVYLDSWRRLKTLPPDTDVANWEWYPMTAREILHRISRGVQDRINLRSGLRLTWRDNSAKWDAERRRRVTCECRWCGTRLPAYQPHHARFCDAACHRNYHA